MADPIDQLGVSFGRAQLDARRVVRRAVRPHREDLQLERRALAGGVAARGNAQPRESRRFEIERPLVLVADLVGDVQRALPHAGRHHQAQRGDPLRVGSDRPELAPGHVDLDGRLRPRLDHHRVRPGKGQREPLQLAVVALIDLRQDQRDRGRLQLGRLVAGANVAAVAAHVAHRADARAEGDLGPRRRAERELGNAVLPEDELRRVRGELREERGDQRRHCQSFFLTFTSGKESSRFTVFSIS